jgi:DICT domain-containing protein
MARSRPSEEDGIPRLPEIVRAVESKTQTLSLLNYAGPTDALDVFRSYFEIEGVSLVRQRSDGETPTNLAVLHDGDDFVAAADAERLYEAIRTSDGIGSVEDPDELDYPDLLDAVDKPFFTAYDRDRMTVISRTIERAAWDAGAGELHTGLQYLSNLEDQWQLYSTFAACDVETHVYGLPDVELHDSGLVAHPSQADEIRRSWFVLFRPEGEEHVPRVLLAEERNPNQYVGFWTSQPSLVDLVYERLRHAHLDADSHGRP